MTVYVPDTFGSIKQIVYNRAKIAADVQERDAEFVDSAINEYLMRISTERAWHWRKFERSIVFKRAETTGASAVTNGSREVVITGLTLNETYMHRSIRFNGEREIYRIIGLDLTANSIILEADYVGTTAAAATHKIYRYEFPLPPDLDTLEPPFVDTGGQRFSGTMTGELDTLNTQEFNQLLSVASDYEGPVSGYTRDGDISTETMPPLDVMVADYDFIAGDQYERISKLRLFPINPDRDTLIHIPYTRLVEPLKNDQDRPLMPVDDRWVLVHYALAEWWKKQGSGSQADREFTAADRMLAEMRQEFHKTDVKPKLVVDARIFRRARGISDRKLLHWISRQVETGGL